MYMGMEMSRRNFWGTVLMGISFILYCGSYFSPWMLVSLEMKRRVFPSDIIAVPSSKVLDISLLLVMFSFPVYLYLAKTPMSKMWSYSTILLSILLVFTRERWVLSKFNSPLVLSRTVIPRAGYYEFLLSVLVLVLSVWIFEGESRWSYLLPSDEEIKREFGLTGGEEEETTSPSSSDSSTTSPSSTYSPASPSQWQESSEEPP